MVQKVSQLVFAAFIFTIFHLADSFYLAAPRNISVFNKTSTSLLIYWEAVTVANDTIFGYRIRHRLNSTSPFHVNATTDATSTSSHGNKSSYENNSSLFVCENRTSAWLTDLQVYTDYWVEVIAFTNETFGNESIIKVFRTDEGVPTSPPLNITETNKTSTSITLSWDAVPTQHRRGEKIDYLVKVVEHGGENVTQYNTTKLSLTIGSLKKFTFYNITVSARTSKGISNASTVFRIQTAEDAPEDPPIDITATVESQPNITSDYIIIKWEPVKGRLNGKLRAYNIRWGLARENASYTEERVNVTSSQFRRRRRRSADKVDSNERTFMLKNLRNYTNYSVEVAAVTVKEGIYSDPVYFLSQEGVPSLPPGNVTAFNTSSTTIAVTWSPPSGRSVQGVLLGYEITYTPAWKNASESRRVMLCKRNTSFHLERLLKYTLYNITVAAFTKVGIGRESEIEQTWTDEDIPDAPENVTAVSKTFSSIDVSWEPVPKAKQNGIITKYEVEVRKEVNVSGVWDYHANISTENLSVVVQNLTMFVKYGIAVRAYTSKGPGNHSDPPKTLMTLETAPSVVPFNLTGHAITGTSVKVKWQIAELEPWFKLRQYVVKYRVLEHGGNYTTFNTSSKETQANLEHLSFFTTYEIQVAAATKITGKFSEPANVTTKEGAPRGAPVNVTAVPETISSIRVSWKPVPKEESNGNITKYNVKVTNTSSEEVLRNVRVSAGNVTVVIERLKMYVTYRFQVQAFTKEGAGPFSEPPVNGTTNQTAPNVGLNVTANAESNSTITVTWKIEGIHDQLTAKNLIIQYCEMERNGTEKVIERCNPCKYNVTNTSQHTELLTGLRSYTRYRIKAKAINIVAKDGTEVTTPYGNYSNPSYDNTSEADPEEPPANVTASPHSTTSIKVEWKPVPECKRNGNITTYIVEVLNSTGSDVGHANVSDLSTVIEGLKEYTNYSVKVFARSATGRESPASKYQNTTTHQRAPKTIPENVTAKATGNSTIEVKWSLTDTSSITGFQGFIVQYTEYGLSKWQNQKLTGSITKTNLTKLRMFTKYEIKVAARTTQNGNYSKIVSAKTLEGVPTEPPDNIDANILETFVEISWGEVPEGSRNGEILGYRITYYQEGNKTYQRSETKFFSVQLKSLGKFSQYHIEILAYTRAGNGKVGNISFKTSDDIPSRPPRNLTAINKISPHKIQVTWEPVPEEFLNGNLLNYLVTYQRVMIGDVPKDYEPELQKIVSVAQNVMQNVMLDNLEPYSKYKIRVAAKTAKGLGPYTAFTYGETCHCLGRLTTSWRRYAPYVNFTEDGKPGQIIPLVLQSMVKECCGDCRDPNQTVLDFGTNGRNEPSNKNSSRKLLEGMDELTDFTFPVYGHIDQDSYKGGFGYTPVIESAGVAFIVHPDVSKTQTTLFQSILNCLPVLILPIVTAYIAGVIIWCLERRNNPDDFPQSFLQGTWEGIWWSFVSMTTLGYGDRAPLSYKGRFFAIAWILFGLIVIAITMAMLTTALTVVTVDSEIKLYGSKIAAEYNSPEYNLGTRRNAKHDPDKDYHSIEEVAEALVKRKVEGVLVDTYAAGLKSDLFDQPLIRVSSVLDYKTAYGIVLSPNSTRLGKCFKRYMLSHRAEIFRMIKTKVKPIETSSSRSDKQAQEESSGGLLDNGSPTFNKALRYACVMLGIALFFSLIYECIRRMRARQKVQQEVYFKTILLREMGSLVEEFIRRIKQSKAKLGEKHRKQIVRFWKLKRKSMCGSGNESEWLRISTASPHRGDVTITDL